MPLWLVRALNEASTAEESGEAEGVEDDAAEGGGRGSLEHLGIVLARTKEQTMRVRCSLAMLLILSHAPPAISQTSNARFEVAAIRSTSFSGVIRITEQDGIVGGPQMSVVGNRVNISKLALSELITRAYGIRSYQLVAPDWVRQLRFDIQATIPQGMDSTALPTMLRTLLEERFGMVVRTEQQPLPVYELAVRQDGARLGDPVAMEVVFPSGLTATDGRTPLHPDMVRARTFLRSTPETDGFVRLDLMVTLDELAQFLTLRLDLPVIDRTGMAGYYQVALRVLSGDYQPASRTVAAADPTGSSWFKALERLGLELKRTRAELPMVIVDRIERSPTEN